MDDDFEDWPAPPARVCVRDVARGRGLSGRTGARRGEPRGPLLGVVDAGVGGYRLTAEGRRLLELFGPLDDWAESWAARSRAHSDAVCNT